MNQTAYPTRKHSVPENLHKPPSPKENDLDFDPLADKPKQSPASSMSSIKPPSVLQPPFVLQQQQQQRVLVSQTKPSPPLANKRSTAIPRKPVATSARNYNNQSGLLDLEYNQMGLPMSHSNEELSTLSIQSDVSSIGEPLSPPPVAMENQPERTFSFSRHLSTIQQQVRDVL